MKIMEWNVQSVSSVSALNLLFNQIVLQYDTACYRMAQEVESGSGRLSSW